MINSTDIQDALAQALTRASIEFSFLIDEPTIWLETLAKLKYVPVDLLPTMIKYQAEYARANNQIVANLSVILLQHGSPCAVWPIIITKNFEVKASAGTYHEVIQPPRFINDLPVKLIEKITVSCLTVIGEVMNFLKIAKWNSADSFCEYSAGVSHWHEQAVRSRAQVKLRYELYLDLGPELIEIRRGIRKSYKSLINKGEKTWRTQVLTYADSAIWNEFRDLHRQVSGRVTRSQATWDMQLNAIDQNNAFFISLRDKSDYMVGGALYYCTRDEGLYAVGAYDRAQFDKPLGHVVQYIAIQEMKARGIKWYKLGARPFLQDEPCPTKKELSIADFKEGFSSNLIPRFIFTHACT